MALTYILQSLSLDRFYTGAGHLDEMEGRLKRHNNAGYGAHRFTAKAVDRVLFLTFTCDDYSHAFRLERRIKSMNSSTYIRNLKKYPELRERILQVTRGI